MELLTYKKRGLFKKMTDETKTIVGDLRQVPVVFHRETVDLYSTSFLSSGDLSPKLKI